jgi:lysophospholipase L1-like esterase
VRLPTGAALTALENTYQPDFNHLMRQTCAAQQVPYLNYTGPPYYPTNDGNHLWRGAARDFSQRLAADIEKVVQ